MMKLLTVLRQDRKGVTALEYGLIAAFVAVALVAVLGNVSSSLQTTFTAVQTALDGAPKK